MPYLNWKERAQDHSMKPLPAGSEGRSVMDLVLSSDELLILIPYLETIFLENGYELRVDLANGWTIFWKSRESGSRLLLAHPEHQEWVATVALEKTVGVKLIERMKELTSGQTVSVHEVGEELGIEFFDLSAVSNVEVRIRLK